MFKLLSLCLFDLFLLTIEYKRNAVVYLWFYIW